jgi:hypothetical protein
MSCSSTEEAEDLQPPLLVDAKGWKENEREVEPEAGAVGGPRPDR